MTGNQLLTICTIVGAVLFADAVGAADNVVFSMDFSGFPGGSVLTWLGSKGFQPKQDASNETKVIYNVMQSELVLGAGGLVSSVRLFHHRPEKSDYA